MMAIGIPDVPVGQEQQSMKLPNYIPKLDHL